MKLIIDSDKGECIVSDGSMLQHYSLYSNEALHAISRWYTKIGWSQKYTYTFSWLGRPLIQMPDDMLRIQEIIYHIQPDIIVETGVAHGGSLIFYASLCEVLGNGRILGIDIEIKSENRIAIEQHNLSHRIGLIEGSSTSVAVIEKIKAEIKPDDKVLIILDSNHSYNHVSEELLIYSPMVSQNSYIVATDGIMEDLSDVPNGDPSWISDNPARAARDFAVRSAEFVLEEPPWSFNESKLDKTPVTYWPSAYLRRVTR